MKEWYEIIMFVIVLLNLTLLSSSRLLTCIRVAAFHGIAVGLLPVAVHEGGLMPRIMIFAAVTVAIKGIVFPRLLSRSLREADVSREIEPLIGYPVSLLMGVVALGVSFWFASALPLPDRQWLSGFAAAVPFSTILTGLFIIVTRRKALTQVIGYLILENGIYCLSVIMLLEQPVLVELGILLDIFVAVFVMGIAIFHINREFDHIDTDELSMLGDWRSDSQGVLK
ncbi:MAG: hydrogenase [Candidatus Omnitrophota bacterium]